MPLNGSGMNDFISMEPDASSLPERQALRSDKQFNHFQSPKKIKINGELSL
jgi:hypothetical protein